MKASMFIQTFIITISCVRKILESTRKIKILLVNLMGMENAVDVACHKEKGKMQFNHSSQL